MNDPGLDMTRAVHVTSFDAEDDHPGQVDNDRVSRRPNGHDRDARQQDWMPPHEQPSNGMRSNGKQRNGQRTNRQRRNGQQRDGVIVGGDRSDPSAGTSSHPDTHGVSHRHRASTDAPRTSGGAVHKPAEHDRTIITPQVVSSFESFFSSSREALVRAVAIVVGSPSLAADLVDEAMLRAFQRWDDVCRLERPGGWVYRVALNLGRSRFRRIKRDLTYRWTQHTTDRIDDQSFADRLSDDRLLAAMLELPTNQRAVVVARVLLDYSEAEVAEVLEIAPGTVKSRLSRGLRTLRQQLPHLAPAVQPYRPNIPNTEERRPDEPSHRSRSEQERNREQRR